MIARGDRRNRCLALRFSERTLRVTRTVALPMLGRPGRIRERLRALVVGSLLALVFTCVAVPASAHAGYHLIVNLETASCLESDQAGDVYLSACVSGNYQQIWDRSKGGWTRNAATGLCLRADGLFSAASISTRCNQNFQASRL